MKTQEEIQLAHDILHGVIEAAPKEMGGPLHASHDVLSWVLDGPCKGNFDKNLKMLQQKMLKAGYRLVERKDKPGNNDADHSE